MLLGTYERIKARSIDRVPLWWERKTVLYIHRCLSMELKFASCLIQIQNSDTTVVEWKEVKKGND
jgi:hypothetical protein